MNDFSNDVRCIYHILVSRVLLVISHMLITIESAHCLYGLLIEVAIDYGSLVTSMLMSVLLLDKGFTLPYKALITWIAEHFKVVMIGLR
jgi:hypothetical protein